MPLNRRQFLKSATSAATVSAATAGAMFAAKKPVQQPNILFILADDLAAWMLGCYGNKVAKTPHMDRLARSGARFLNAFVATPVCSPSRASMLTGRYGSQLKITDWITPNFRPNQMMRPSRLSTRASLIGPHLSRFSPSGMLLLAKTR